jgi:16S rRNA (cytosine1402-N4)-methyltransferase
MIANPAPDGAGLTESGLHAPQRFKMSSFHLPVLPEETIKFLNPRPGEVFVDATLGGGGHAKEILKRLGPTGKLIGIDQDPEALAAAKKELMRFGQRVIFAKDNFINLENILQELGIVEISGVLFDLGPSTHQLETPERGFSFGQRGQDAPLDMRMNPVQDLRADDIVNFYPEKKLREIFFRLGEEPYGGKIAHTIAKKRQEAKIETCGRLLDLIRQATPPAYRYSRTGHWASKIFRALRMEVNQELPVLEMVLPRALHILTPGGRLAVISFHSLEDKIVKHAFGEWEKNGQGEILTKKPVVASPTEIARNPKSDSAKLRVFRKELSTTGVVAGDNGNVYIYARSHTNTDRCDRSSR